MQTNPIGGLVGFVNGALEVAGNIGDFLAGPTPDDPLGQAAQDAGRRVCRSWGNAPLWARVLPGAGYLGVSRACTPYLSDNGWDAPVPGDTGFPGGQCPTTYTVEGVNQIRTPSGGALDFDFGPITGVLGPISYIKFNQSGRIFAELNGQNGNVTNISSDEDDSVDIIFTAVREDGEPDDCPSEFPSEPGANPPPDPGNLDPDTPTVDPDGGLRIPVPPLPNPFGPNLPNIELPDIVIPPGDDGLQPIAPDGGGDAPDPDPRPGEEQPGANGSGDGTPDDFPPPDPGTQWVGACITVTVPIAVSGSIPQSVPQDVYPTIIGNARLILESDGVRAFDTPLAIRQKTTCLWVPLQDLTIVGVFVNVLPGVTYAVTPYRITVEET